MRLRAKNPIAVSAVLIAFACLLVMGVYIVNDYFEDQAKEQETIDTSYSGCLRYNDTRLLLRSIIETAYLPDATPSENAARAAELVARIQDPAVRDLIALQGSGSDGAAITDPTSKLNVQRNKTGTRPCEQEYPDHSKGLDLSTTVTVPPPPLEP